MADLINARKAAQEAFLEMLILNTDFPASWCEIDGGSVIYRVSTKAVRSYCEKVRSIPGGATLCEDDQCIRPKSFTKSYKENLSLCHAGLFNQAIPFKVKGEVQAAVIFGKVLIADQARLDQSLGKFKGFTEKLCLNEVQRQNLKDIFLKTKKSTLNEINDQKRYIYKLLKWPAAIMAEEKAIIAEENQMRRVFEKVSHEIITRLQPVIAIAENLKDSISTVSQDYIKEKVQDIFYATFALSTVVHNIRGEDYLGEYQFKLYPIGHIIEESIRLYKGEADPRGIDLQVFLKSPSKLEVSRDHLQYAFNNLIHNAIKYSFRGSRDRYRYIVIEGQPEGKNYKISIENYGVGILAEERDRIFDDGYQGKLTQGEQRTGSGKGLYFAKQVIITHNGELKATSTPIGDSKRLPKQPHHNRFILYLPYQQQRRPHAV